MTQIHVVIRRISPALKIDLVQVGYIKEGRFSALSLDDLKDSLVSCHVRHSSVADSLCIEHCAVSSLVSALSSYPKFSVEFFDNTLVLMFDFKLGCDEGATEEEGKGN